MMGVAFFLFELLGYLFSAVLLLVLFLLGTCDEATLAESSGSRSITQSDIL